MTPASIPIDEARRLFALRRLQILDTEAEPAFDHITRLACQIFAVPIAVISFIDKDRQWFKSKCGLEAAETSRDVAFCGYTIHDERLFIVNDAHNDERFCDNPLVTDEPYIQAYAGTPIHAPTGERIGSLCIIDKRARTFNEAELEPLHALAAIVEDLLCRTDDLLRTAYYDALTGLPNRLLMNDKLHSAMTQAQEFNKSVAVLAINIDQFKTINQAIGHQAGDMFLKNVARRISECVGNSGYVGRTGADEFQVVSVLTDETEVSPGQNSMRALANKILERLAAPFSINEQEIATTASIGVSVFPKDSNSISGLFACADAALTQAKNSGRNLACYYDEEAHVEPNRNFQLYNELRHALAHNEFELYYQPEIEIATGDIHSVEALLRWQHPRLGLLAPADFIDVAEESGLIIPIGEWVLQEACREAQKWRQHDAHTCHVSVNLSGLQFKRDSLEHAIQLALHSSELSPECLELEMTESILSNENEQTQQRVQRLKTLGISMAIDDFGTGYSNLTYLRRFAFNKLKIDQSFIRRLTHSPEDIAIVKAILQLADNLQLKTVAEGVESMQQLEILRALGCQNAQGYLLSRPMPAAALHNFLRGKAVVNLSDTSAQSNFG